MRNKCLYTLFVSFFCLFSILTKSYAQSELDERHIKVAMRMIGHEMLLHTGDNSSRVLPVEKVLDRYKIQFDTPLHFYPEALVTTVDSIIQKGQIANRYIVEVETCDSNRVVYSYEVGISEQNDIIPCKGRKLPRDCYQLYISLLKPYPMLANQQHTAANNSRFKFVWLSIPLLIILALFFFYGKKKSIPEVDPDLITIGNYVYDKRNMTLSLHDNTTELTSKESDLLYLLYSAANRTLEREHLLNVVWGDEGDYIGRTLDVFISKLRKKLADDENLKIVNIRGVGYKFVVNYSTDQK